MKLLNINTKFIIVEPGMLNLLDIFQNCFETSENLKQKSKFIEPERQVYKRKYHLVVDRW